MLIDGHRLLCGVCVPRTPISRRQAEIGVGCLGSPRRLVVESVHHEPLDIRDGAVVFRDRDGSRTPFPNRILPFTKDMVSEQ